MDGSGRLHRRIGDQRRFVGQRVAGQRVFQLRDGADIARVQFGDRLDGLAQQRADMRQPLGRRCVRALIRFASFLTHAGHHFEVGHAAGERIGHGLEHECRDAARNP